MERFVIGQGACWYSQSQGRATRKVGIVVQVVAPGERPVLDGRGAGGPRSHESYVVEVLRGKTAKLQRYWPVVSNLHQAPLSECVALRKAATLSLAEMKAALELALPDSIVWNEDAETWFVTRKAIGEGGTEEEAVRAAYLKLPFLTGALNGSHSHARDVRQAANAQWVADAFGAEQAQSIPQRGVRLLEESDEAAQAAGVTREMAHRLVDYVWDRPVGKLNQELGGVGVTTLALASAAGLSADAAEVEEIQRIQAKPLSHFAQRNTVKNEAGFLIADGDPATQNKGV